MPGGAGLSPQEIDLGCPLTGSANSEKRALPPGRAVSQYLLCRGMPDSEGGWVEELSSGKGDSLDYFEVIKGEVTTFVSDD